MTWVEALHQRKATTLIDCAGRYGLLATAVENLRDLGAILEALETAPTTKDQHDCERNRYANGAWLAANARRVVREAIAQTTPTPTHITRLPIACVHPDAICHLEIHVLPKAEPELQPTAGAAVTLLGPDLIQAIERHAVTTHTLRWDFQPPRELHQWPFDGSSLEGAAATSVRLATLEYPQPGDPGVLILAGVAPDQETLIPVGFESDKLETALKSPLDLGLRRIVLAVGHKVNPTWLKQMEAKNPGFEFCVCQTVADAVELALTYYIPAKRTACPMHDQYYREDTYSRLAHQHLRAGVRALSIQAADQRGKSSLFDRLLAEARDGGTTTIAIDLATVATQTDSDSLYDILLEEMESQFAKAVGRPSGWTYTQGTGEGNFNRFLDKALDAGPLLIAFERAEELKLNPAMGKPFFAKLRERHEQAKREAKYTNLRLMIATAINPARLIPHGPDSPFNVGEYVEIPSNRWANGNTAPIQELNELYGSPLDAAGIARLQVHVGGHPMLIRTCIHSRKTTAPEWTALPAIQDHLQALNADLRKNAPLRAAFKQVLASEPIPADLADELKMMGLINITGEAKELRHAVSTCHLDKEYFDTRI